MHTVASIPLTEEAGARILLIAPPNSYRTAPFLGAARKQGIDLTLATSGKYLLVPNDINALMISGDNSDRAVDEIEIAAGQKPFAAILGTDDATTELATRAASRLGIRQNDPQAALLARRKDLARVHLHAAGLLVPDFQVVDLNQSLATQAKRIAYPCVLKPLAMSGSRGVIRADDQQTFIAACKRIAKIIAAEQDQFEREHLLAESFIPGYEIAVEGLMTTGKLQILTIFDKPEPLNGPFFEETCYITPTTLDQNLQQEIKQILQTAYLSYGYHHGPIHAECRINEQGVWIIELAIRTIGGLCARLFSLGTGFPLEELVLTHALNRPVDAPPPPDSVGVMMIPIPQAGILRRVEGILAAQKIECIEEIVIYIREGYELVPLPEGASYLGFIYARAPSPDETFAALRRAHAQLNIVIAPLFKNIVVNA